MARDRGHRRVHQPAREANGLGNASRPPAGSWTGAAVVRGGAGRPRAARRHARSRGRPVGAALMEPSGSLAQLLAWRAAERPDFPVLYVEEDGPWTVGDLASAASGLADSLDVSAGARVVVRVGNDERFLPALMAVWLRGAAAILVHPSARRGRCRSSRPRWMPRR